jgi:predicted TIM-barrel fold metal-dependent hydrolase
MVIDAHCHLGKGDGLTAPWNTDAPLQPYLRRAQRARIDRTVVMPPFHTNYARANAQLARLVARYRQRFIPFACVHPKRDAGRIRQMVDRAIGRWGFRGIKVHRHDGAITREICEVARDFGVPVLYDVLGQAALVEQVASQYPNVNFIVPHLGSFGDDWRAHRQVIDQMTRLPNVYADSSAVRRFDYLVDAIKRAGPERLLFGSDGPWLHPGVELHKIRLLGLAKEDEDLVLGRNLLRLLDPR